MTEAEALHVALRMFAAVLVIVGVYFAIVGVVTTWTIVATRHRQRLEAPHGEEDH